MVHDKTGFLGDGLRRVVGTHSGPAVRVIIATMWIVTGLMQLLLDPETNLFAPVHKILYLLFQVDGPKKLSLYISRTSLDQEKEDVERDREYNTRLVHDRCIEFCRVVLLLVGVLCYIHVNLPPSSLQSGRPVFATTVHTNRSFSSFTIGSLPLQSKAQSKTQSKTQSTAQRALIATDVDFSVVSSSVLIGSCHRCVCTSTWLCAHSLA